LAHLPLLGRRVHIAGAIDKNPATASKDDVKQARDFVKGLVIELLKAGATFVVPVDANPVRETDNQPICFDWLIQETISHNLSARPRETSILGTMPLIVAVQHHKTEAQIPIEHFELWDQLRVSDQVYVENANQWNMNSKRLEMQAAHGDILITLGGDEGVLYLANLYHEAGKPVVPLNFPITSERKGSRRLFDLALTSQYSERFLRTEDGSPAHGKFNQINFVSRHDTAVRVEHVMGLLAAIERPTVFGVRLLNDTHKKFKEVDDYFVGVVGPVIEEFLRSKFVIVDGKVSSEESNINLEIFTKLSRSNTVIADMTGERPNNFIELGYALGRGHRVMVTAQAGTALPFDTQPVPTRFWSASATIADKKRELIEYLQANATRRRIVEPDPLVP
jgi:hypothetical protein